MWTQTYTGERFYPERPFGTKISIIDIAHALSNLCRFGGHTEEFYSVAQHSVLVSAIMEAKGAKREEQLAGLLHDATEAYLIDLPSPIKKLPPLSYYGDLEANLAKVIERHFDVACDTAAIKEADMIALSTEARDLLGDPQDWESIRSIHPFPLKIKPALPARAKVIFLQRFLELTQ